MIFLSFSLLSCHLQWKINLKWIFKWSWHQFPANFRPTSLTTHTKGQSQLFSGRSKKISAHFYYLIFQLKRKFFTFSHRLGSIKCSVFLKISHRTFSLSQRVFTWLIKIVIWTFFSVKNHTERGHQILLHFVTKVNFLQIEILNSLIFSRKIFFWSTKKSTFPPTVTEYVESVGRDDTYGRRYSDS